MVGVERFATQSRIFEHVIQSYKCQTQSCQRMPKHVSALNLSEYLLGLVREHVRQVVYHSYFYNIVQHIHIYSSTSSTLTPGTTTNQQRKNKLKKHFKQQAKRICSARPEQPHQDHCHCNDSHDHPHFNRRKGHWGPQHDTLGTLFTGGNNCSKHKAGPQNPKTN